jgi:high-affinity iron transporter
MTALVIGLREGLEAALIVGILLGALRQLGRPDLGRSIWCGVISAIAVGVIAAAGLVAAGIELEGAAEQVFEGVTLIAAAVFLTGTIFWMKRQGKELRTTLEAKVRDAAQQPSALGTPSGWALFAVAFFAVVREGLELALLLVATSLQGPALNTILGAAVGIGAAVVIGILIYRGVLRLNLRTFFGATNALLLLFAAGMVALGIHELIEASMMPAIIDPLYNFNPILSDKSTFGALLKSLLGYNGNPALSETIAYIVYLGAMGWLIFGHDRKPSFPQRGQTAEPAQRTP